MFQFASKASAALASMRASPALAIPRFATDPIEAQVADSARIPKSRHRETVHFPLPVDYFRSKLGCTFFSASTVTGPSRPDGASKVGFELTVDPRLDS